MSWRLPIADATVSKDLVACGFGQSLHVSHNVPVTKYAMTQTAAYADPRGNVTPNSAMDTSIQSPK